jgi:RP/EB family microtubule-associated protein
MMDAAYFTGRKELLEFFNDLLDLNLSKIEQTASGAIACQITELIFPGSIPMTKVDWGAKSDYEFVQNYKLLQAAFTKNRVQRHVDVDKLIRAKYQDNLEFCQWLKAFYEQSGAVRENYDPVAVRAKGKNGTRYNAQMGSTSRPMTSTATRPSAATHRAPSSGNTRTTKPGVTTATSSSSSAKPSVGGGGVDRFSRPLRDRPSNNGQPPPVVSPKSSAVETELMEKNQELSNQVEELSTAILEIEKERDFYFEKLRHVEILLQVHQERGSDTSTSDINHLFDNIFKVLYATMQEKLTVTDEGEVVAEEEAIDPYADSV